MLEKIAEGLLQSVVNQPPQKPVQTQIEIPGDHPLAEKLAKLARALADRQQLPGGVVVEKLMKPNAVDEFLDALRPFGIDVDEIKRNHAVKGLPLDPSQLLGLVTSFGKALPVIRDSG